MFHEMISCLKTTRFTSKDQKLSLTVQPIILDFRKLLLQNDETKIAEDINSKELLHTTVALFDTALPEVTGDLIYSVVTDKWARTLVLLESTADALNRLKRCEKNKQSKPPSFDPNVVDPSSMFEGVFSDVDSSSSSEEEEGTEPDFSEGGDVFIKTVQERRQMLENSANISTECVGLEHRLVGCATYEKCFDKPGHKVLHLTLITVRKRWRKLGIGKYIMSLIKDPTFTIEYDIIIVNADYGAIDFFEKLQFTDDVLANSTYAQIGDTWFHSKRMCYLPAYLPTNGYSILPDLDLKEMELDITLWKEKSLQCYQAQAILIQKLRHEILQLRAHRKLDEEKIKDLQDENDRLRDEKFYCEQKLLKQRMELVQLKTEFFEINEISSDNIEAYEPFTIEPNAEKIKSKILIDFNNCGLDNIEICNVFLSKQNNTEFLAYTNKLRDKDLITEVYFCGDGENDQHFYTNILENGFNETHMTAGEYGKGLYFSDSLLTASHFSKTSILLLVKVGLGKVETVTSTDATRTEPPNKSVYDSILIPGRLSLKEGYTRSKNQTSRCDYVIFNIHQAKPLALIEYKYIK